MSKITVGFTKISHFVTAVVFIRAITHLLGKGLQLNDNVVGLNGVTRKVTGRA